MKVRLAFIIGTAFWVVAPASAQTEAQAKAAICAKLDDVLRLSADRILGGADVNRVLIALSASERLNCDVAGLLEALSLRSPRQREQSRGRSSPLRDSDNRR